MSLTLPAKLRNPETGYAIANSALSTQLGVRYLSRSYSTQTDPRKFTASFWLKKVGQGEEQSLLTDNNGFWFSWLHFNADDTLRFKDWTTSNSGDCELVTAAKFRDSMAWYHIVLAVDTTQATASDRAKLYVNGVRITDFSTETYFSLNRTPRLTGSGKLQVSGSYSTTNVTQQLEGYLTEFHFVDGQQLDASSFGSHVKDIWAPIEFKGAYGSAGSHFDGSSAFDKSGNGNHFTNSGVILGLSESPSNVASHEQTSVLSYGMDQTQTAFAISSGQGSGGALTGPYANDGDTTYFISNLTGPANIGAAWTGQDFGAGNDKDIRRIVLTYLLNNGSESVIVQCSDDGANWFDVKTVTGLANATTPQMVDLDGSAGAHRYWRVLCNSAPFYHPTFPVGWAVGELEMLEGATFGNNIVAAGNFAGFSNIMSQPSAASVFPIVNNGGQGITLAGGVNGVYMTAVAPFGVDTGKWYWEIPNPDGSAGSANQVFHGVTRDPSHSPDTWFGGDAADWSYRDYDGAVLNNGSATAYGSGYISSDHLMVALDADLGAIWFGKNGVWESGATSSEIAAGDTSNAAATNLNGMLFPAMGRLSFYTSVNYNFGADALNWVTTPHADSNGVGKFEYEPPTGFLALNTTNVEDHAIVPADHATVVTYTGNGTSQSITGVGFQPDFVWVKNRTSSMTSHYVVDAVRGAGWTLFPDDTTQEFDYTTSGITSFDADGFSVGSASGSNENASEHVAWCLKANGTGVSNSDGSINSTVSANTDSGFSIVTYTGTGVNGTIGHGLGVAPKMMIVKSRSNAGTTWWVYHHVGGNTHKLELDNTSGITSSPVWNNTSPTAATFSLAGSTGTANESGVAYVAYCFADHRDMPEGKGIFAIGFYDGDGDTSGDGPYEYLGGSPLWWWIKSTSAGTHWKVWDAERGPHNPAERVLHLDSQEAEAGSASTRVDAVSNGFKVRLGSANTDVNQDGYTYPYLAVLDSVFANNNRAR